MHVSVGEKNDLGKALIVVNGCSGEYAPAFSNKLHPCSAIISRSNDEVMLFKRFFDGGKITLVGVK